VKRLDIIFVVRMDCQKSYGLNKVLLNHFKESVLNILEIGFTYNVSVHFIDFLGLRNNIITFNNINYVNNDINSIEYLYGFLSDNIYNIICAKKDIVSFTGEKAILNLIGLLEDSNIVYKGYDFEGAVID
jgi:hypothetical protein